VWLHGAGLAGDTWRGVVGDLPRAKTPNLPGHGDAAPVFPPRVERYAEALADGVPTGAVLIGHSLGGMVALEIAARRGTDIAALVLVEAVPTVRDTRSGLVAAAIARHLLSRLPVRLAGWLSGLGEAAATQAEMRYQFGKLDRPRVAAALEAAIRYDGRPRLARIAVPTLIIVGRRNAATHRGAKLMAAEIPEAAFQELAGGHMLHTDGPLRLRRAIEEFLRGVEADARMGAPRGRG
jgi:pimeloyl-ACP methyl ester carboxylesterase